MKHLATGVVILLLCLALCFTSLAVLDRWTTHATSQLEQALELADREYFDEAEALVTETWDRTAVPRNSSLPAPTSLSRSTICATWRNPTIIMCYKGYGFALPDAARTRPHTNNSPGFPWESGAVRCTNGSGIKSGTGSPNFSAWPPDRSFPR